MKNFIKINSLDNIIVAIENLQKGEKIEVDNLSIKVKEEIKKGHKMALKNLEIGDNIIKYGNPIGHAIKNIEAGQLVHSHNIKTNLDGIKEYSYNKEEDSLNIENKNLTFEGYIRKNGDVGIRNELWIVPTVGCVNGMGDKIIESFKKTLSNEELKSIDAIEIFKHNYGCSQLGDDHINTRTMLANMVNHPNAGGVLVLGLGCENNTMVDFKKAIGDYDEERVKFLVCQEVMDEISEGVKLLKEIYEKVKLDRREEVHISKLKVGLKCGGSDGLSGITANPLVGEFSDFLIAQGGTTILTEVPEMFGAETILMNRAKDEETFHKVVNLINDFKKYFMSFDMPIYENPSPGNKLGGITTLEDKSLGCTQKSGKAIVIDVLKYGERVKSSGLNLLSAPGNDLVAASALAGAGCQLVLFTTGRGTPFGSFVPTIKIATNSEIYKLKPHWMDFNAGRLVEDMDMNLILKDFISYIIEVVNGKLVNNEINGFREIAIFKKGITL